MKITKNSRNNQIWDLKNVWFTKTDNIAFKNNYLKKKNCIIKIMIRGKVHWKCEWILLI